MITLAYNIFNFPFLLWHGSYIRIVHLSVYPPVPSCALSPICVMSDYIIFFLSWPIIFDSSHYHSIEAISLLSVGELSDPAGTAMLGIILKLSTNHSMSSESFIKQVTTGLTLTFMIVLPPSGVVSWHVHVMSGSKLRFTAIFIAIHLSYFRWWTLEGG